MDAQGRERVRAGATASLVLRGVPRGSPRATCITFTALNHFGLRASAAFNNALVLAKLLVLILFCLLGVLYVQRVNFTPFDPATLGVLSGTSYIFFAYGGFARVAVVAEEVRDLLRRGQRLCTPPKEPRPRLPSDRSCSWLQHLSRLAGGAPAHVASSLAHWYRGACGRWDLLRGDGWAHAEGGRYVKRPPCAHRWVSNAAAFSDCESCKSRHDKAFAMASHLPHLHRVG